MDGQSELQDVLSLTTMFSVVAMVLMIAFTLS
jgi:hypothetical protein